MGKKVGYCRLSRDEDKKNYSSIEEQIQIINDYASSINEKVDMFYIDDNVSGYLFNRPEFNKMLDELYEGNITTIYTKDLSRIGRNNGRVLTLIDDIREMGKNLILVNELGGTLNIQENQNDCLGITAWYNERLVRDVSNKVKSSLHSKQKNGTAITNGSFGYYKDPLDRTKLIIDDEAKETVKIIFDLYVNKNYGFKIIANHLNDMGYKTPSQRRAEIYPAIGRTYGNRVSGIWSESTVGRIIQDDIYIGNFRTHKYESKTIHGKKSLLKKESNYVFENHHEPIIDDEMFNKAQELVNKRGQTYCFNRKNRNYIFRGMLKCGNCGTSMCGITRVRSNRKDYKPKPCYICSNARKKEGCETYNNIREEYVLEQLQVFFKEVCKKYNNVIKNLELKNSKCYEKKEKERITRQIDRNKCEYKLLIEQKIKSLIGVNDEKKDMIERTYNQMEDEILNRIKKLEEYKENIKIFDNKKLKNELSDNVKFFKQILKEENLNSVIISKVLDKAYINGKNIEFKLKMNIDELLF